MITNYRYNAEEGRRKTSYQEGAVAGVRVKLIWYIGLMLRKIGISHKRNTAPTKQIFEGCYSDQS